MDVGARTHRVAVGDASGQLLEEFGLEHTAAGLNGFFDHLEALRGKRKTPVAVAMEGFNGWARPLDRQVLERDWKLYYVNNLKLARYKEIFPAPAKTDAIDARRILELFRLSAHVPLAREVLQEVTPAPPSRTVRRRHTVRQVMGNSCRENPDKER